MSKSKDQASRPSGSSNRRRHPRVYARVTEGELIKITSDAYAHGLSVGGYLRWLALDKPQTRPVRMPLADVRLLSQIKGQVGKLGGNLHQLLRLANRGEMLWSEEIAIACKEVSTFLIATRDLLRRSDQ